MKNRDIIIKQKHDKKCWCVKNKVVQYNFDFDDGNVYFGNYVGNKGKGSGYIWLKVRCNDPECNFQAVVNNDFIAKLIRKKVC